MPEAVKLISNAYAAFVDQHLSQRLDDFPLSLRFKVVFMHDNAPSYAMHDNAPSHAMAPTSFKETQAFVGETLVT